MIPAFDDKGYLPSGIYAASMNEFKTRFVDDVPESKTRAEIFAGYMDYCEDVLKVDMILKQWLDGSYTTNKIDPNDMDIISHVDALKLDNSSKHMQDQVRRLIIDKARGNRGWLRSRYKCEPFAIAVYPEDHPLYSITQQSVDYWSDWFGHDRRVAGNPSKGLIEIDKDNLLNGA